MATQLCAPAPDKSGRETARHGTALFPLACYEDDLEVFQVPWHWHEEFECIFVTAGTVAVGVNGGRLLLRPGQGIFIGSGVLHSVEPGEKGASVLRSLVFLPRLIGGSLDSVFWQKLVQPLLQDRGFPFCVLEAAVPWQGEMLQLLRECWQDTVAEAEDWENLARYRLSAAFRLLNLHRPDAGTLRSQDMVSAERVKTMLRYIQEHYAEELTVERIADQVNVSPSVCLRCFRQALGTTPIQYVRQYRLERAAQLLLATNRKVGDIGLECGFSDISYFTKTFREEKGVTPKEYRYRETKRDTAGNAQPGNAECRVQNAE